MSWGYRPYVSVAERKAQALKEMEKLRKKGKNIQPIEIEGRKITRNFWGQSWCDHLEAMGDYSGRIDRGRTYVRNGSVCHLDIQKGKIGAYVSGTELYKVKVEIKPLDGKRWNDIKSRATNQIGSLLDLLQGKIPDAVLKAVTNQKTGLFPSSREIDFKCNCPDGAYMCKHIAAVLYGVGARLDVRPELLFELRGTDPSELIDSDLEVANATTQNTAEHRRRIAPSSLEDIFGIEIMLDDAVTKPPAKKKRKAASKKASKSKQVKTAEIHSDDVVKLRKKFKMSQREFAKLLKVGVATVSTWECKDSELNLKQESLERFKAMQKLTVAKAWAMLE